MTLAIKNLSLSAGGKVLVDQISFELARGETLALVGESGSGKSISALAVMQLLPPAIKAGAATNVTLAGEVIAGTEFRGRDIAMIFQEPMTALNPLHSIGRQIEEAITLRQTIGKDAARKLVVDLLKRVGLDGLTDRLHAYPHELSGGQRQRVMIAMAIANKPKFLIADEPTTALDVTVQKQILDLLHKLQREENMGLLLITHDLNLVKKYSHRTAVMQHGRIVETGDTAALFASPQHEYTRFLIDAVPRGKPPQAVGQNKIITANSVSVNFAVKKGFFGSSREVVKAVDDVSFDIREGETLGIVGESGSGKSTLAFAVLRLVASRGSINLGGTELTGLNGKQLRPLRKKMQIVFQDPFASLNPRMNVGDIVAEGVMTHNPEINASQRSEMVARALAEVGLTAEMAGRYPHEFSGGQRQRIAIARAIILNPALLILDEPTSALDAATQAQVLDLLRGLQVEKRLSYMFISHDLRVIRAMSHKVLVLKNGRIIESGAAEKIFSAPETDYTKTLLEAACL